MAKLCILHIVSDWTGPIPPEQGPPGIWGGANQPFPTPPIHIPPQSPGVPTHPIYYPPGIWGGGNQPFPTPPIHIPPQGGGGQPPGIWGGGNQPFPTPPINMLPDTPPPDGVPEDPQGQWIWIPGLGWVWKPGSEDMQPHEAEVK